MEPLPDTPDDEPEGDPVHPDDLELDDRDEAVEIEDGRYVIGTDGTPSVDESVDVVKEEDDATTKDDDSETMQKSPQQALSEEFSNADSLYGFDVTAKFEDTVAQQRLFSDDVITVFDNLILWYAQKVGNGTPVEEVLGLLLMEANVPIRYPENFIFQVMKNNGISEEDSVKDLIEAVKKNNGVKIS